MALKTLLWDKADEFARELGVIRRQRVFTGASLVQTLVFGWLNEPQATRDKMAQMAARCQAPVREQSLDSRFTPTLAEFLRRLIEYAAGLMLTSRPRTLSLLQRFRVVDLQDSTVVSLPDELKSEWPSCGGNRGQTAAALKVQVRYDLLGGVFRALKLEPGKQPDQATTVKPEDLPAGALHMSDLGYFDIKRLAGLASRKVYFLSRIQVTTAIFDERSRRLDLPKWLDRQKGETVDCRIKLGASERLDCRLVAVRCSPEVMRKRRERLQRQAQRKSRSISTVQWALCGWTVFVTNVPAEMLSVREALIAYGARWQVELLFKAWKGGNRLAQSRSRKPVRILCEVYAKLLGIMVQQWVLLTSGWSDPARSLGRALSWVRNSAYELAWIVSHGEWDRLETYVADLARELSKTARITRRRKEPSTYQLLDPQSP